MGQAAPAGAANSSLKSAFPSALLDAADDLRWLLDRNYPKNASVKLVGDRHRLDRSARQVLYRGVVPLKDAERRRKRLADFRAAAGRRLAVDGHNLVLTVANFIAGVPVFLADDGLLRDIGALHGRLHNETLMHRALDLAADHLSGLDAAEIHVAFDEPLSHSRDHASRLRQRLTESAQAQGSRTLIRVETARSGDEAVKACHPEVVVTSDSAIIDSLETPVLDLARVILEREFAVEIRTLFPAASSGRCQPVPRDLS